ncbi:MAG TPA: hypothetical protein PK625_10765, partial [Spirochaetales bacterium]|nr:hypothetical protein [Spirochaetales bacterium]
MSGSETLPRWDLSPIFPSFDSAEYRDAKAELARLAADAEKLCSEPGADTLAWLRSVLDIQNTAGSL